MKELLQVIMSGIIATLLLISFAFSAYASDYKTMIRYDRVWESICHDNPYDIIKYMKFDGTEEINGKTWHRIVTFRKAYPTKYDQDTKTFSFEFEDNVYENEGYMREENGIVFTLVDKPESPEYVNYGHLYLSSSSMPEYEVYEEVIYNFSCKDGETYKGVSFLNLNLYPDTFKVIEQPSVMIDGEECRKIGVAPTWYLDINEDFCGETVIESIGAIDLGCLNYTEFVGTPTMFWYHNYFIRLLDMQGNVIFSNDINNFNVPYKEGFLGVETVGEGCRMLIGEGTVSFGEDSRCNSVTLYNMQGQRASTVDGVSRVCISTAGLTPGVYIAVASTDGKTQERRKIIVK
ncbi:MAG: T9SS type A sorting domain-containing protein [Muribaculaceae bacterium]|nr:T9SS type A sorting domain-containing protein [Muribaculaceae bacterium]